MKLQQPVNKETKNQPATNSLKCNKTSTWANPEQHFHDVLNSSWYKTIQSLSATILTASYEFFKRAQITPVCLPINNQTTDITNNRQFYLEYLLRQGNHGTFAISRFANSSEPSATELNQFFQTDVEIKGDLQSAISLAENYIKHLIRTAYLNHGAAIYQITKNLNHLENITRANFKFPKITFADAFQLFGEQKKFFTKSKLHGLTITELGEQALIEYSQGPVWLTELPSASAPFYQAVDRNNNEISLTANLLMGVGNTAHVGQRFTSYAALRKSMHEKKISETDNQWYLELKRCYPIQTAGFSMNIERLVLWLLNHNDIRDIPLINRLKGIASYL